MKLLLESTDIALLMERSALLEAKGIPTYLEEVAHVGAVPQHLYALLDEHFADAVAVLADDTHIVSKPVFADQLQTVAGQFEGSPGQRGNRLLSWFAGGCLLVLLAVLFSWS